MPDLAQQPPPTSSKRAARAGASSTPTRAVGRSGQRAQTAVDAGLARRQRVWRRLRPDRGATSVEMVGYTAVMLAALLIGVQAAVWGLGELACRYAANHAVQVARVQGGSAAAGEADAATVLGDIHGNLVTEPQYVANRGPAVATITVKGKAVQVIPFLTLPVGTTVSAPVEVLGPEP